MDRRSIDFATEIIRARSRIDTAAVETLADRMLPAVLALNSSHDAMRDLQPDWIGRIVDEEKPRALRLLLAVDLAIKSLNDVCSVTEEAVEAHLTPAGFSDVLDRWGTDLSELLHEPRSTGEPWYGNTANRVRIPPEVLEEFHNVAWAHVLRSAAVSGGVRLQLLSTVSLIRVVARDTQRPAPPEKRISRWRAGSLGALIFGIGAAELLLDVLHFQPLHSGVSLAGGVCSVGHGGHLLWHAIQPRKPRRPRSADERKRGNEEAG